MSPYRGNRRLRPLTGVFSAFVLAAHALGATGSPLDPEKLEIKIETGNTDSSTILRIGLHNLSESSIHIDPQFLESLTIDAKTVVHVERPQANKIVPVRVLSKNVPGIWKFGSKGSAHGDRISVEPGETFQFDLPLPILIEKLDLRKWLTPDDLGKLTEAGADISLTAEMTLSKAIVNAEGVKSPVVIYSERIDAVKIADAMNIAEKTE